MPSFNPIEGELGPGFIGFTISLWLYGSTLSQTIYYFRTFPDDSRITKCLACFLCVVDTLHVCLLSHMFWGFLVYGPSVGFSILLKLPWQLMASFIVGFIINTVVQCFFGLRVWKISFNNRIIASIIGISSTGQLCAGMAFSGHLITVINPTLALNNIGQLYARTSLACSLVCDLTISVSMVYYFSLFRDGMKRSKDVLQLLIILSVNMGVLLSLATAVTLILVVNDPGTFTSLGPHFVLSKLYINSLLATLNSRKHFRAITDKTYEYSLPTISTVSIHFSASDISQHDSVCSTWTV